MARIGGALYLLIIVIGGLEEAVVRGGIVSANAMTTATNLRDMEWLWRLGMTGEVVLLCSSVALAVILYSLLHRVHRELAQAAILFNLICIAIEGVAAVSLAMTLAPLSGAASLNVFTPEQLAALATLAVRSHTLGFAIGLIFFGVECVILGVLIVRSRFMPRTIGLLMQLGGAAYLVNSFALLLYPPLSRIIFPAIMLPALVAELSLAIWLLTRGVRPNQWQLAPVSP